MSTGPMFDRIAGRYDRLNRLLSMGVDRRWRAYAAKLLNGSPVLDVATGTGDLALAGLAAHADWVFHGIDISQGMLDVARQKLAARPDLDGHLLFSEGSAEAIPFKDGEFGSAMIAFGIRNVSDRRKALAEMHRVLLPGGRLLVMEFGMPGGWIFGPVYAFYLRKVLPLIGGLLSDPEAYRYLSTSVPEFPPDVEFLGWMEEAGFASVRVHRLTMGIVNLFIGEKPA